MNNFNSFLNRYKPLIRAELMRIKHTTPVVGRDDLWQEASMAVFRAYNKYRDKSENERDKLVRICIRHGMRNYIDKFYGPFRLPQGTRLKIRKFTNLKKSKKNREEICDSMNITEEFYDIYDRLEGIEFLSLGDGRERR